MSEKRRSYDKEFKISAVKLVLESEKSVESIASDLGVSSNTLFNWKRKYLEDAKNAFPGKGKMKPEDEELRRVKKELLRVTMERDILKKALGYFAKIKE
ncbi:MAG: IS2 repressor TnpA [Candidatus Methanofastidiosum methylothiophilum]|uniref:IS2 repressor TnpA n=1 Tax=Candidatus Methanofastidiosum methylothiophilum TaxID=1705564 RepID=A0A150IN68_9EURY|nr:MAG: IS2 repressor TnpA [Candidatus Methanofastidiosum methylthiophilus]